MGSSQTQPEKIPWNNHPVCQPPTGKDIEVGCTVDWVAGNDRKLDMLTPGGADCSRRDMVCKLFGGEGMGAGVESRAVPTKYSWTHLNATAGLWNQASRENSVLSRVVLGERHQTGVGILTSPWLSPNVLEFSAVLAAYAQGICSKHPL